MANAGADMTIAYDICSFVTSNAPQAFCDACVQRSLAIRQRPQVAIRTEAFGATRDFTRVNGECSICRATKLVIRAAEA